ncbi:hypothetical protein ACLI09_01700 [Flavobacterium sp. RHBU_24]|uniref:hypothetical protein n=1 Tax=Flavobacterium sp. RHBU_24 TaxID=3391185 RepID=UPI0039852B18
MTATIRLRIKKDIDTATEKKILKMKGGLISQSFTDLVHFDDDGEEYYINHFSVENAKKEAAILFITDFIAANSIQAIEFISK